MHFLSVSFSLSLSLSRVRQQYSLAREFIFKVISARSLNFTRASFTVRKNIIGQGNQDRRIHPELFVHPIKTGDRIGRSKPSIKESR